MSLRIAATALLLLLAGFALAFLLSSVVSPVGGPASPGDTPPEIRAGTKLYRVVLVNPDALPGLPPTSPLEVVEVADGWVRVESPVLPNDPFWLNLSQVVRYQTQL